MKYLTVKEVAIKWNVSERSVRNYCASNRIEGAFLNGKTWNIPFNAVKPDRVNSKNNKNINNQVLKHLTLLDVLKLEKRSKLSGGIYHKIQVELTYNSNHIEGSKLTFDQTRYIFDTNTISLDCVSIKEDGRSTSTIFKVDNIVETVNHFKCIDMIIDNASKPITEKFIKELHRTLKSGTSDARNDYFAVGDYKRLPNTVGDFIETCKPEEVESKMRTLLFEYNSKRSVLTLEDLLDFHYKFECIHPFQDGNGRVGRLLLFKECLKHNIVPFIIDEEFKYFYYRGLREWKNIRGYLLETCLALQDKFKLYLDYFKVEYKDDNNSKSSK